MAFAKISQVAHYVPEQVVTNHDLAQIMDTNDEWISSRTGIRQRHISRTESTSDLATEVAKKLMAKAGITGGVGFYHPSYHYSRFDDALYSCSCSS